MIENIDHKFKVTNQDMKNANFMCVSNVPHFSCILA